MKRILGLDLGTGSVGWAVVDQAENESEQSQIIKMGVRVVPVDANEKDDFEKGKSVTTTADRNLKHGMRVNLQRYKQRRQHLINVLKREHFITDDTLLYEDGNQTTFETYRYRARAATEEISLEQLARVLLMINKKRGYKSNRKADKQEDGQLIDGMAIARKLYDEHLTPGQLVYGILQQGKRYVPTFYRSDLRTEFMTIWNFQAHFYPDILDEELMEKVMGRSKKDTSSILYAARNVSVAPNKDKKTRLQVAYRWRSEAVDHQLPIEQVAAVLCDINGDIAASSGYLGQISDHSKELYFNKLTVGQYLMRQVDKDPHYRIKNKVFYRQDYLNEFNTIWETQQKYHPELTDELKEEVRDTIIFYQRKLKSKKGLISYCELEGKQITVTVNGKPKKVMNGPRVCPKSSPLYQEFKIWQELNNVIIENKKIRLSRKKEPSLFPECEKYRPLTLEQRKLLHGELSVNKQLNSSAVLKLLGLNDKDYAINFKELHGNTTQVQLIDAYKRVLEWSGHDVEKFDRLDYSTKMQFIKSVFEAIGAKTDFLTFNPCSLNDYLDQPAYRLWHLLYSYEGDNSDTGDAKLKQHLMALTGLSAEYVDAIASLSFEPDYASLSAKAIRRILPHLLTGMVYSDACEAAGYRHSAQSLSREELEQRPLDALLEQLPKNSLRNPVVEKILNQMIHVVNAAMQAYGIERDGVKRFDEIHVEMARCLKQTKTQREKASKALDDRSRENEQFIKILQGSPFGIAHPSRNDIIRYRLYIELKDNGFKTLYSNTYIPREELFGKRFEIEHIIPQARLFDDSQSNKTLETHEVNLAKGKRTAMDYVLDTYGETGAEQYRQRIAYLYDSKNRNGTNRKYKYLIMTESEIPGDFLNRDLADTQYISRKAREILMQVTRRVVPTTGAITARLREDWQLVDVLKELNMPKYEQLGLVETHRNRDGKQVRRIKDWSKRNDHRHHAMDALTVAFTRLEHIQYLNNLNAHNDEEGLHPNAMALRHKIIHDRRFVPPMPLDQLRSSALEHMNGILVSIKAKNKVATPHVNRISGSAVRQVTLTPRAQLHNETIYGQRYCYVTKVEKVGGNFDAQRIAMVARKDYREALMRRLDEYGGNAKKAFTGKNALSKNPLYIDALHIHQVPENVKLVWLETYYTVRKPIDKSLDNPKKIAKVVDRRVRDILLKRYEECGRDASKAFSNLDENPIWLNEEKGIAIKRVTLTGISVATPLRDKLNRDGIPMVGVDGNTIPVDYVSTSNNHHVAIYEDADGNWHEKIVSYYEAITRLNQDLPIVDRHYNEELGWKFQFTMKQNEYFVLPDAEHGFLPTEVDLMDEASYGAIVPHLFRVQKLSTRDYFFRHQYETSVTAGDALPQGVAYVRIRNENGLKGFVKVRINHVGQIVHVGEY
jgi:CRISPR-associated endonuclease Csn1